MVTGDIAELRAWLAERRGQGGRVGLVPTMGNLHAGHLALVERARAVADLTVASIFVNPLQFGPGEDYDRYPRTVDQDLERLAAAGIDLVFLPSVQTLYPLPREAMTQVSLPGIGDLLEGEHRPGFFTGVMTVVLKLFNVVTPDLAVFGEKDFQQLVVVRRLVADLDLPVEIVAAPTVREPDGLAMSSRNGYLSAAERQVAPALQATLSRAAEQIARRGLEAVSAVELSGRQQLEAAGFGVDYFTVRRAGDLAPPRAGDHDIVLLAAASLGSTRLIDNVKLNLMNWV